MFADGATGGRIVLGFIGEIKGSVSCFREFVNDFLDEDDCANVEKDGPVGDIPFKIFVGDPWTTEPN